MKKVIVILVTTLGLCLGQPADAGIGFGIPLPVPFLVWTPSRHCSQEYHGNSKDESPTTAIPKSTTRQTRSAVTHTRSAGTAGAATGLSGLVTQK
jgi:hypothetical protein